MDDFLPERLRPSSLSDADWRNGVWIGSADRAGFRVTDARNLSRLAPGLRLHFARSGPRTVRAVERDTVWVDGPPLDPEGDGYPHRIEVRRSSP